MTKYTYSTSAKLLERAKKVLAGGVSSEFRKYNHPHAIFYSHAKGSKIYDVDGNEYLDFTLSQGPLIIGHSHPAVLEAVSAYSNEGQLYAGQHLLEIELAEKLQAIIPSAEMMRFCLDGSEAVQSAFRIARAKTGKQKFLRFEGHYHGWLDNVAWGISTPDAESLGPRERPRLSFDPQERITFGNAILMLFVWYVATIGSDQMAIQRYISTKDLKSARQSLRVSLITDFTAKCLLALVGLAVLAYFTRNPELLLAERTLESQADTLFPRFILIGLPQGLSGLVIAGLLAAAMSSLSSGLNAVSSVIYEDLIIRFQKKTRSRYQPLTQIKRLTLFAGALVIALSLLIGYVPGNLYDVIMKVVNLLVCPLFVLFFMALFVPIATETGTFIGGIVATLTALAIGYLDILGITVLWIAPISLAMGVVTSVTASYIDRFFFKQTE